MPIGGFVVLLVIALVVAAALHYGAKLYVRPDALSFVAKIIWAYIGAWMGTPVFGIWGPVFAANALIPALLGALAILIVAVDLGRTFARP